MTTVKMIRHEAMCQTSGLVLASYDHFEPPEDELLRIFSMGDLEYGFALWLGACAVSSLVFFGEVLNVKSRRFVATLAGLIEFLSAIVELTRRYHDRW
jgi:hypothetical protein